MTDKTREDFERWAKGEKLAVSRFTVKYGGEYLSRDTQVAWQAYQQGIADARKEATETAAEWIARHENTYKTSGRKRGRSLLIDFIASSVGSRVEIDEDDSCVSMPLETASDCIKLCELLRVTPVERS